MEWPILAGCRQVRQRKRSTQSGLINSCSDLRIVIDFTVNLSLCSQVPAGSKNQGTLRERQRELEKIIGKGLILSQLDAPVRLTGVESVYRALTY